jgi:hypothetical protein
VRSRSRPEVAHLKLRTNVEFRDGFSAPDAPSRHPVVLIMIGRTRCIWSPSERARAHARARARGCNAATPSAMPCRVVPGRKRAGVVRRYTDALDLALPTENEFDRAASMLLKRAYAS